MKDDSIKFTQMPPPVCTPETEAWKADGAYLSDSQGRLVAQLLGDPQDQDQDKRRVMACLNAMRGISTEAIEDVLRGSSNNLVGELVNKHLFNERVITGMQESLRMHAREIEQLRETLRAAHAYELQRAAYARAPGAKEYQDLCRTLGIGSDPANPSKTGN